MNRRPYLLMALLAVAGVGLFGMPTVTGATFSSVSTNAPSTVTSASDWTPPTVSLRNPGTSVKDIVTLTADAADSQSGIAQVTLQYLAPGTSTWVTLCTASTPPYSCSWNTKAGADGSYDLRAVATDRAGFTTVSDVLTTNVANNLLVVLGDPGDVVKGNVPLTATLYNAGILPYSVTIQYLVSGSTGSWKTLCTAILYAPYSCSWNTTGSPFTQGESYDLRAVATNGLVQTTSAVISDVMIDNVAPSVSMVDPGTPLRGTVTFVSNASDADSGVDRVQLQYQKSGTATWTTFCTATEEPYSCRYATTALADGTYAFRAIATDEIGNTATSAAVTGRTVDNTVSSVSMEDPGAFLSGSVTLRANAASTAGVASVRIERAPSGTSTWTAVCTDAVAPYACVLDTTTLPDGLYDFRAVMTDSLARTLTSTAISGRRIDNSPLRGYDVQTTNGGSRAARVDAGDTLRFTYTELVAPSSISAGWNGSSIAVTLRLRDANVVGSSGNNDTVDVQRNGATVNLGSLNLKQNFIKSNKTATFNATMVASTTMVNGTPATMITITVGSLASGGSTRSAGSAAAMVWTPSALALDTTGASCSTAPVTESGTADKDF